MYRDIGVEEARKLIEAGNLTVLDVRLREDWEREKLPGAINIFFGEYDFEEEADELLKDKPCLVYCKVGVGSLKAINMMEDLDFEELYHMAGGIDKWKEMGYETE
ncbi:hypothetical protein PM10SUCC1_38110 [Propionigenium maris DSM 9537]|uniref:Rhodanese domain-containing protein n=1 Tax=Propionigenium maris DSM 9537 TaxID=1123000 RepID=A0A9W6GPG7_9FUSO|nr:rhodanese-like domain-containing protein [Propionigenium maris]GLI58297.1 hypothetical protein PM10SUCC1_38110 [Propionigenium maris DSM 9537]